MSEENSCFISKEDYEKIMCQGKKEEMERLLEYQLIQFSETNKREGIIRVKDEYAKAINEKIPEVNKTALKFEGLKVLSLNDLSKYDDSDYSEWIIEGILQPKKIGILSGSAGTFKSWTSLNMAFSVALGKPFVDNFPTKQGGVLVIGRENSLPELKERCLLIGKGANIPEKNLPLYFISEQSIKLDTSDLFKIQKFVEEKNIILIIVDTYRRAISFEENSADDVSYFFTDLIKPLCEKTGVSFLFLHHHKKGKNEGNPTDMIRGSSDFVNYVDSILQISRNGDILTLKQTKNRGAKEISPFQLRVETDENSSFKFVYYGDYRPLDKVYKAVEVILKWIAEKKILTFKTGEVQEIVLREGNKKTNFHSALNELVNKGEIKRVGHGSYEVVINSDISDSSNDSIEQLNKNKQLTNSLTPYSVEQLNYERIFK